MFKLIGHSEEVDDPEPTLKILQDNVSYGSVSSSRRRGRSTGSSKMRGPLPSPPPLPCEAGCDFADFVSYGSRHLPLPPHESEDSWERGKSKDLVTHAAGRPLGCSPVTLPSSEGGGDSEDAPSFRARSREAIFRPVYDMAEDDSSVSGESTGTLDWCFDTCDMNKVSPEIGGKPCKITLTPGVARARPLSVEVDPRRSRGRSLPASLPRAARCRSQGSLVRRCHGSAGDDPMRHHNLRELSECMQVQGALSQEFSQLRHNQIVCLQTAQETAQLVVEMNRAVEAERAARMADMQERAALRTEMRTVCAQVDSLARGQRELQQCMMAMFNSMQKQTPQQTESSGAALPLLHAMALEQPKEQPKVNEARRSKNEEKIVDGPGRVAETARFVEAPPRPRWTVSASRDNLSETCSEPVKGRDQSQGHGRPRRSPRGFRVGRCPHQGPTLHDRRSQQGDVASMVANVATVCSFASPQAQSSSSSSMGSASTVPSSTGSSFF